MLILASDWLSRLFVRMIPTIFVVGVLVTVIAWLKLARSSYSYIAVRRPEPASGRQEPLAVTSLGVALILTFLAVGSDVFWVLHQMGLSWLERVVWMGAFLMALTLLICSWRRERRYPGRWRGRYVRVVTACVLGLNVGIALVAWNYGAL